MGFVTPGASSTCTTPTVVRCQTGEVGEIVVGGEPGHHAVRRLPRRSGDHRGELPTASGSAPATGPAATRTAATTSTVVAPTC